jgi:hypothetical protein
MDNTGLYAVGLLALTGSALAMAQAIRHTLSIPAIGVEAAVTKLGLRPDSTVEVPTDPDKTGWFRLGPFPGQRGSAVILGHVDSHEGPAVFIMLRYLKAGDRVQVTLANGRVATFVVERKATYPNDEFPAPTRLRLTRTRDAPAGHLRGRVRQRCRLHRQRGRLHVAGIDRASPVRPPPARGKRFLAARIH